jgi:hypothetical protein
MRHDATPGSLEVHARAKRWMLEGLSAVAGMDMLKYSYPYPATEHIELKQVSYKM